jgi:hypothetical protein
VDSPRLASVACSSTSRNLTNLSPAVWDFEVERGVDPREAPNPLTITELMRSEALRIAGHGGILERLKQLQASSIPTPPFFTPAGSRSPRPRRFTGARVTVCRSPTCSWR